MSYDNHCVYEYLPEGVHKFALVKADRQAMDEFVPLMIDIFDATPLDETILLLIDFRPDGIPPLTYAITKLLAMLKDREVSPMRGAYLHQKNAMTSLIVTFLDRLRLQKNVRRLFAGPDADDEAIAWLLSG